MANKITRVPRAIPKRDKCQSRLYELRMKHNLSQNSLAIRAGVSRNTVMMIENGDSIPNLGTIMKLCKVLGVSMDDVFGA